MAGLDPAIYAALVLRVVGRLISGENPMRVWRDYRGLSLRALAEQTDASPSALSDIETGKSAGRPGTLQRVAKVLAVGLDDLLPTPPEADL